jgi:hypothetical protein
LITKDNLELGVGGPLVGDELDLDRLHRRDGQDGLGDASSKPTKETGPRGEVTLGGGRGAWRLLINFPAEQ